MIYSSFIPNYGNFFFLSLSVMVRVPQFYFTFKGQSFGFVNFLYCLFIFLFLISVLY